MTYPGPPYKETVSRTKYVIRVTIELVPLGFENLKELLATAEIRNDATGSPTTGNYVYELSLARKPKQTWKQGRIVGFKRRQQSVWYLLYRVLKHALTGGQ